MQRSGALPLMLGAFILGSLRVAAAPELRFPPKRIAVIGAGIGGTSAAYFLRQRFGKDVPIDIFEKGDVGGRLATIEMEGNHYEAGGAIIHPLNLHMKTFVKELGLNVAKPSDELLGIFNGDQYVFEESEWFLINIIKMLWNYGLNFLRMYMWVEDVLDKYMRIYRYQTHDYSFSSTKTLLHAMGGNDYLEKLNCTIEEVLQKSGFSQKFIDSIVVPAMRVNYQQGANINGFVGAVSLAGTDSGLWSVEGGNKLVCNGLLYASKAQLIRGTVTSVQEKVRSTKPGNTVRLYEVNYATDSGPGTNMYDIVIIATPLNKELGNIDFVGFSPPIEPDPRPFQVCVSTFVYGQINASYFGYPKASQFHLSEILTTGNPKFFISSISAVSPVKPVSESVSSKASGLRVWKVFSPEVLTEEQLHRLFETYQAVSVKKWLAYPKYCPPEKLPPIILHRGIYYVNSIEWAASAMEMSAVSAMNVALLSHHRWYGNEDRIDQENLDERLKSEL